MELLVLGGDAAHSQGLLGSTGQVPGKTLSSSGVGAGHRDRPWGCLSCQCPVSPTLRGAYGLSWGGSQHPCSARATLGMSGSLFLSQL